MCNWTLFFLISYKPKHYVVGTQKNNVSNCGMNDCKCLFKLHNLRNDALYETKPHDLFAFFCGRSMSQSEQKNFIKILPMNSCILSDAIYSSLYISRGHRLEFSTYDILVFLFTWRLFYHSKNCGHWWNIAAFQLGSHFCKLLIYGETCKQMLNSSFPVSCMD